MFTTISKRNNSSAPSSPQELSVALKLAARKNGEFSRSPKKSNNLSQTLLQRRHWFNLLDHQKEVELNEMRTKLRLAASSASSHNNNHNNSKRQLARRSSSSDEHNGGPAASSPKTIRKRFNPTGSGSSTSSTTTSGSNTVSKDVGLLRRRHAESLNPTITSPRSSSPCAMDLQNDFDDLELFLSLSSAQVIAATV